MMGFHRQGGRAEQSPMASSRDNTWLTGKPSRAATYLATADLVLVERARIASILVDIFRYHFAGRGSLSLFNLGCGDGVLTDRIRSNHPGHAFHVMDGSEFMIQKARRRLGDGVSFIHQTFEEYVEFPTTEGQLRLRLLGQRHPPP